MEYKLDIGQASIIGMREEQQDAMLVEICNGDVLAVVCDGMGGMCNGREISLASVQKLRELYRAKMKEENYPEFLQRAINELDEYIYALKHSIYHTEAAGTTIVAAVISENQLFWTSVGDSRLYIIRNHEIVCVTSDHNYNLLLNQAYQNGKITALRYEEEKKRGEALISYIGMGGIELIDMNYTPFSLQSGDIIILMSDGLYRCVSKEEMLEISMEEKTAQNVVAHLIEKAEQNAGNMQDNTTVVAIRIGGGNQ